MRWQELKNDSVLRGKLWQRALIIRLIRDFLGQKGFLEIDSPLLVKNGNLESNLDLFKLEMTKFDVIPLPAYLITSPEYSLKKILAAGFSKVFQLGKCFRDNEPWNETHNPEFTLLEWYETDKDYKGLMDSVEELILFLLGSVNQKNKFQIDYQNQKINFSLPWVRLSMREAWENYAGVDLNDFLAYDTMRRLAEEKGYPIGLDDNFGDLFFKIFLSEVEPKLVEIRRPIFLYDYPTPLAALSQIKKDDPRYAERFELYLGGLELANAYTELIDPIEQGERFKFDQRERKRLGKEALEIDQDFLEALKSGLPPCAGLALGVDRLIMFLTDSKDISEVVPFTAKEMFNS